MEFYNSEENNRIRHVVNWIVDITVVIAFAWFIVYAYGTQIPIAGHSMTPLLQSEDIVLMDRLSYDFGKPDRFDVVVFEREDQKMNVKRVIGLPGETVQISNGAVLINGEVYNENKNFPEISNAGLASDGVSLESGEYFVLGDNRNNSEDSRYGDIGNINKKYIVGKVWFVISPKDKFGFLKG